MRLAKYALALAGAAALAGCQANEMADGNKQTAQAPTDTELAAYAAAHPFPSSQQAQDSKIAAIAAPDRASIRLYNFSDKPYSEVDVWVNGSWVQHVRGIPANGSVVINSVNLYNAFGKNFASQKEPIARVQIRTENGMLNAMGPIAQ